MVVRCFAVGGTVVGLHSELSGEQPMEIGVVSLDGRVTSSSVGSVSWGVDRVPGGEFCSAVLGSCALVGGCVGAAVLVSFSG